MLAATITLYHLGFMEFRNHRLHPLNALISNPKPQIVQSRIGFFLFFQKIIDINRLYGTSTWAGGRATLTHKYLNKKAPEKARARP